MVTKSLPHEIAKLRKCPLAQLGQPKQLLCSLVLIRVEGFHQERNSAGGSLHV